MKLEGSFSEYDVEQLVAETATYRVYLCEDVGSGKMLLLQIATSIEHNGGLSRGAYILRELKQTADLFEAEYAKANQGRLLSYDRLFPLVVDSFKAEDQGDRQVNILAFTEVDDPRLLVPLSNLASKDHKRVSLVSSAWIMGRLLKLLGFAHGERIAVRSLSGSNILLEPTRHFAFVFDWSSSLTNLNEISRQSRKDDIASAAKAVFAAIGGNPKTGAFQYPDEEDPRYVKFLWDLACRHHSDAQKAHDQFYELVEEIWGRKFRSFTTLPL